jgi:hypothetical protein
VAFSPEERARLYQAKLQTIVASRCGPGDRTVGPFPSGATLIDGGTAWVLSESSDRVVLGGAVSWAVRAGADRLQLIIDGGEPGAVATMARRAELFARPVRVLRRRGTELEAVDPILAPGVLAAPDGVEALMATIRAVGCEVVVEQGVVRGELFGLEVCRIDTDGDGPRLEVGVGSYDREIALLTYAELAPSEALARVVGMVAPHRRAGAPIHPMRDLCRERWLRVALLGDPGLVGATGLEPIETTQARENLRDPHPALAAGVDGAGRPVVVACTVGADLDVLPIAEDTRFRHDRSASLVVVYPAEGPPPPGVRRVGEWLAVPPRWIAAPAPWS